TIPIVSRLPLEILAIVVPEVSTIEGRGPFGYGISVDVIDGNDVADDVSARVRDLNGGIAPEGVGDHVLHRKVRVGMPDSVSEQDDRAVVVDGPVCRDARCVRATASDRDVVHLYVDADLIRSAPRVDLRVHVVS